jgi:hypothetical protein
MATIHRFPSLKPDYDLFQPPHVVAPSPAGDGSMVELEISDGTLEKIIRAQLRVPLFQCWAHLVGEIPPVNNGFKLLVDNPGCEPAALRDACACFKGVRRPYGNEDYGDDVFVYVISTRYTVTWRPDMACVAEIVEAPEGTVMTVQVRPASALQPQDSSVWGVITKWEFVGASTEHPDLPDYFDERYNERLWPR